MMYGGQLIAILQRLTSKLNYEIIDNLDQTMIFNYI